MGFKKGGIPWNKGKKVKLSSNSLRNLIKFRKGYTPWNKNKELPKKIRDNISKALKGHLVSDKTRKKLSKAHKGKKCPWNQGDKNPAKRPKIRKKISKALKGKKLSDKHKEKLRQVKLKNPVRYWLGKKRLDMIGNLRGFKKGNRPWNWLGGISFEPYGLEFNNKLKEKIRKRDNYTCQECGKKQKELGYKLHIHHIDYNKKNNQEKNLISLCRQCHLKTNFNRKDWTKYFRKKMKK